MPIGPQWRGEYFLGADANGRDVMVRLLYGARNSLLIGLAAALLTTILATIVGLVAGYFGRWVDAVARSALDVIWAFPVILLGVALGTALAVGGLKVGPLELEAGSMAISIVVIAVVYVPYMARPIRGEVLALREREFVEAARAQGAGPLRTMVGELLPNLASTIIVFAPLMVANAILLEAALSFLGVGVVPPDPSWGNMIDAGVDRLVTAPHLAIAPGSDAGADGAGAERLRRRRPRRLRPALERGAGGPGGHDALRRIAARADGRRAVRRLGADVPDLQRDPRRRSGRADGRQVADRERRSRRSAPSGASTSPSRSSTSRRWSRCSAAARSPTSPS